MSIKEIEILNQIYILYKYQRWKSPEVNQTYMSYSDTKENTGIN